MKYKIKFLNFLLSILAVFLISNVAIASKIDDNTLRIHFKKLPSDDISTLGLWSWDDVKLASEKKVLGLMVQIVLKRLKKMISDTIWI